MQWKPVESSQISEVGHDPETSTLGVRFKAKGKWPASEYTYEHVTTETFNALVTADSVGRYFESHIKANPAIHPYTKN